MKLPGMGDGKTGLNQNSNQLKMIAWILVPFVIVWLVTQFALPIQYQGLGGIGAMIFLVMWVFGLWAKQTAASAVYVPFPQSHWHFPDGSQQCFDILLPPEGWKEIANPDGTELTYSDGSKLYYVGPFKDPIAYQDPNRTNPDVFRYARWKIPGDWTRVFKHNAHCEFFFDNLFVSHPKGEYIQADVVSWEEQSNTRIPTCVITGCSYDYKKIMESQGRKFEDKQYMDELVATEATVTSLTHKNGQLTIRNKFLEQENQRLQDETPRNIQRHVKGGVERAVKEVTNIMDLKESRWRYLNLKTIALVLIVICVGLLASHFLFGWP